MAGIQEAGAGTGRGRQGIHGKNILFGRQEEPPATSYCKPTQRGKKKKEQPLKSRHGGGDSGSYLPGRLDPLCQDDSVHARGRTEETAACCHCPLPPKLFQGSPRHASHAWSLLGGSEKAEQDMSQWAEGNQAEGWAAAAGRNWWAASCGHGWATILWGLQGRHARQAGRQAGVGRQAEGSREVGGRASGDRVRTYLSFSSYVCFWLCHGREEGGTFLSMRRR